MPKIKLKFGPLAIIKKKKKKNAYIKRTRGPGLAFRQKMEKENQTQTQIKQTVDFSFPHNGSRIYPMSTLLRI